MRADVVDAAVGDQPAADGTRSSDGHVESGAIGHPRGASLAGRFSWSKTTLTHGSACTPLRHTPPRPYPPFPAVPALRSRAPPHPVRKPQCSNQSNLMARGTSHRPPQELAHPPHRLQTTTRHIRHHRHSHPRLTLPLPLNKPQCPKIYFTLLSLRESLFSCARHCQYPHTVTSVSGPQSRIGR